MLTLQCSLYQHGFAASCGGLSAAGGLLRVRGHLSLCPWVTPTATMGQPGPGAHPRCLYRWFRPRKGLGIQHALPAQMLSPSEPDPPKPPFCPCHCPVLPTPLLFCPPSLRSTPSLPFSNALHGFISSSRCPAFIGAQRWLLTSCCGSRPTSTGLVAFATAIKEIMVV